VAKPAGEAAPAASADEPPEQSSNVRPITSATPVQRPAEAEISLAERLGLRANGTDGQEYDQNVGPVK
jgi:hypothetical protein